MSRSYSIALYTLRVKSSAEDESELTLNSRAKKDAGKNGISFYDFIDEFVKKYKESNYEDKATERLLRITKSIKEKNGLFYVNGIVEKGDSGFEAVLHNINTHKEKSRTSDDAELLPYYFCIAETTNPKVAVLCLQRSGNIGVKTIFQEVLKKSFRELFSEKNILIIEDHLPSFCKDEFIKNNDVKRVSYSYTEKVKDIASLLEVNGEREYGRDDAIVKIIISPARGTKYRFKNVADKFSQMLPKITQNILKIDDSKKMNTSITFANSDGKTRTFSIDENRDILPYIDITNEVETGPNGHPDFKSIKKVIDDILVKDNLLKINGENKST